MRGLLGRRPQTISIATGTALIALIDYRIEIVMMCVVFLSAAAYLCVRRSDEAVEVEPAAAA